MLKAKQTALAEKLARLAPGLGKGLRKGTSIAGASGRPPTGSSKR